MISQFSKKPFDDIFCSLKYHVYHLLKRSCFELSGDESTVFFEPKSWWKDDIYWLLESSCFELFGDGKCGLFLRQKVDRKMILIDYWKVLVFNFLEIGNTFFFEPKSWWKDDIYLAFLSFLWYPRTWEIWLFVQWSKNNLNRKNQVILFMITNVSTLIF